MARGTKPLPTAIKKLRGNPGRRPLNEHEPAFPPADAVVVPDELAGDERAVTEWRRLLPMLQGAHAVTEAERASLIALCQQWSRYLEANASVARAGMVIKAPTSGYPMPNPYIGIANKALMHCTKLWAELGLTPSSRTRVQTVGRSETRDPFAEFDDPSHATH